MFNYRVFSISETNRAFSSLHVAAILFGCILGFVFACWIVGAIVDCSRCAYSCWTWLFRRANKKRRRARRRTVGTENHPMGPMRQVSSKLIVHSSPPHNYSSTSHVRADHPVLRATSAEKSRTICPGSVSYGSKELNSHLGNDAECDIRSVSCQELINLDQGTNISRNELNKESKKLIKESNNSGEVSNTIGSNTSGSGSNTSGRGSNTSGRGSNTSVNGSKDIQSQPTTFGCHVSESPIGRSSQEHSGILLKSFPDPSALRPCLQPEAIKASSSGYWFTTETDVESIGTCCGSAEWRESCAKPEAGNPDRKSPSFRKVETENSACSANMAFVPDEDKMII